MAHTVIKPEKLAATAAVALEESLVVPAVMQREGIEQFKGAKNDAINIKVEGILPFRTYGWRNDRSQPIVFDEYSERTIQVTFGGNAYSAVKLTDEQNDMDFAGWVKLVTKQTEAVGRGLEREAVNTVVNAPYNVILGGSVPNRDLWDTLLKAREILTKFHVPRQERILLVGSEWETALLSDDRLSLAKNVGEDEAVSALRDATIGRRAGFRIVAANELPAGTAIAMVPSAFVFATGAPSVPQSVGFGASASHNGVALRWIRDYDANYLQDRSVVNTYMGFRHVKDPLVAWDNNLEQAKVSTYEHFVRAIKLDLEATSDILPDGDSGGAAQELYEFTGVGVEDGAGV